MATSASNEASEIRRRGRQRLVGAVAIVLLLVVFVPMVLDSEPRPARNEPALSIPSKDNPPPLPPPVPAAGAAPRVAVPAASVAEPPKAAGVTAEPAAKAAPGPKLDGFAVQVGAFRDEEKLRQARDKLAAAGIAHYTERLESSAGALTRLRAGPFATREAAEAAAAKLRGAAVQGQVVPLP
jgi:DedD protein